LKNSGCSFVQNPLGYTTGSFREGYLNGSYIFENHHHRYQMQSIDLNLRTMVKYQNQFFDCLKTVVRTILRTLDYVVPFSSNRPTLGSI
jgi:hypothetical protein